MTTEGRLLSRSGGLIYHLRANRHRGELWRPFRAAVAGWLADWSPRSRQLVIVGPSGGYTLPAQFLARFDHIVALEPDPVARWMLTRRFHRLPIRFDELDCFADAEGPARLAAAFPAAAILYSNVIGQLTDSLDAAWLPALRAAMARREWASYHDVVSTGHAPARSAPFDAQPEASLEEVLAAFWEGGELTLTDHGTFGLAGHAGRYAMWALTPQRHHLIEWQCAPTWTSGRPGTPSAAG